MNIPEVQKTKADLNLFFRLSRQADFKEFRDYLTRSLAYLRDESDILMDRDLENISKGARQVISDILNATEEANASKVYDRVVERSKVE